MGRKNKRETNLTGDDRDLVGRSSYGEPLFIKQLERELNVHQNRYKQKQRERRKRIEQKGKKKRQKKRVERYKHHNEEGESK